MEAARQLVVSLVDKAGLDAVLNLIITSSCSENPSLVSVHAYESNGDNAIPMALSRLLSRSLDIRSEQHIPQINVVSHTGADGYTRLARQAAFNGPIKTGSEYVMIDDFVGQGGTLANLHGGINSQGAPLSVRSP